MPGVNSAEEANTLLEVIQETLEEAGAEAVAAQLLVEEIDGQFQITAGGADLSGHANTSAATIGKAISSDATFQVVLTEQRDPGFLARGAATTKNVRFNPKQSIIRINPRGRSFTVGRIMGGALDGRTVIAGFTLGTKLIHELGHALKAAETGIPIFGRNTDAAALRAENKHRKNLGRSETWIRRVEHD